MNISEEFLLLNDKELEECNGGGLFWVFVGGVWKLIDDAWFN